MVVITNVSSTGRIVRFLFVGGVSLRLPFIEHCAIFASLQLRLHEYLNLNCSAFWQFLHVSL